MKQLTQKDKELIKIAKDTAKKFSQTKWKGQVISTVGAALRTKKGKIYAGPNIFHPDSASSLCAEYTAIAKAYSEGHKKLDIIVAYWYNNKKEQGVISPCGKCREFMRLFGNPWIIINTKNGLRKVKLNKMLPFAENW